MKRKETIKKFIKETGSIMMVNKIENICDYNIPSHYKIDVIKAEIKRWRSK